MAKYSTGGSGGGSEGESCELCGRETSSLRRASVAGAKLQVCSECAPHDDAAKNEERGRQEEDEDRNRKKKAAQNAARIYDASKGSSKHWEEEGTDYEGDRLPYLVDDYGDRLERARQDAGLTTEELAAELEVPEDDVLAVEQGRAARAGVGGSVVRRLEEHLDVGLIEES